VSNAAERSRKMRTETVAEFGNWIVTASGKVWKGSAERPSLISVSGRIEWKKRKLRLLVTLLRNERK
jgi:hypothetical protein